ncbi:MAG TPA: hypothetical protein DCG75_15685 [Bacteroidales bacterium]|nr:hypothetical protein [Bacteroidales bacterium]
MGRLFSIILILISFLSSCNNQHEEDINLKHLNYIAESINKDLEMIRNEMSNLASSLQYKIPFDKEIREFSEKKYHYRPGEILFCTYSISQSAVYYPANRTITDELKKTIVNSESLDTLFSNSIAKIPLLSQVYFLDTNSFLRIYPYIDVVNYLKNSVDLRNLIAYQTSYKNPFIQDKAYWANQPFADPYGRGWIISCTEPVYYRDQFMGILSGDITLRSMKNKYFSSGTQFLLLIDREGQIICCTKEAAKMANVPPLREFNYYKPVTENVYIFNTPSLTEHKNKSFSNAIKSLLAGKKKESFYLDSKNYTIYKSQIPETDWLLLKIIN